MHSELFETTLFGLLSKPFALHTYGVLIASGFLLAMLLSSRQAKREGEDPDRMVDLAFYVLLAGLIGSRIVYIFTDLDTYLRDPIKILMFWRGGLVWYGGFIGAAFYYYYYCRKHRLPFFKFADIAMPYVALAHAFGRFGCLAAGCCFGEPCSLPWGINFPVGSMAQQAQQVDGLISVAQAPLPVHPTQLYEAGFELAMFWLLISIRPFKRFHGQLLLMWLAMYPVARSIIEVFRGDKERGIYLIMSTSQWISIGVAAAAVALYVHLRRVRMRAQEA